MTPTDTTPECPKPECVQGREKEEMRVAFEAIFPMPGDCAWSGNGYSPTEFNAWDAQKHCERWVGFKAATEAVGAQAAPSGRTLTIPLDAYLWLMGFSETESYEPDRPGAFWYRGAFSDRAGLDAHAIFYEESRRRAEARAAAPPLPMPGEPE